ncbi:MAG TPA: STAS/SEC14 domain-containing protein [Mucilaginibacter sp.]
MKTSYKCERMAIVSNEKWVRRAYEVLRPLFHGQISSYSISEFHTAKEWVCVEPESKKTG